MTIDYFDPLGISAEPQNLTQKQSRELLHAIERNRDTKLVQVLTASDGSGETLVVDIYCDEIPTRNSDGLLSPERFAITIETDKSSPPKVFSLRKNFPNVMHLNATPSGTPKSLCLYFESNTSIMRSWTAAKFLRRIQWWLNNTARGTLHAADQPVELPFFDSGFELVIPPNFDEIPQKNDRRFFATLVDPKHTNGSSTLILREHPPNAQKYRGYGLVTIDCPPIIHGQIGGIPNTLGSLSEDLKRHGIDLKLLLHQLLLRKIGEEGASKDSDSDRFLILLNIPICRAPGYDPEHIQRLALLALAGQLDLGVKLGTYFELEGKVFRKKIIGEDLPEERDWHSVQIVPAAVLNAPSPERLRNYSGVQTPGPSAAVLIGGGALGSELLNLWVRSGWGDWTVVDNDHLKPHNLARHTGFENNIGQPKAYICANLANAVYGKNTVQNIEADALDFNNVALLHQAINKADLIVDCSTTLDFPRQSSKNMHLGRHVSLFLTPSGNGSVLLMEDKERVQTLRTLEAQYYRAIISNDWGKNHLTGHLGSYWSGFSCRDISYKLPHFLIVIHAGTSNSKFEI